MKNTAAPNSGKIEFFKKKTQTKQTKQHYYIITSISMNQFGINLLNEIIKNQKGNVIISAYSIASALSIAALGASGETKSELEICKFEEIESEDFISATALWIKKGLKISGSSKPLESAEEINNWVSEKTKGNIKEIIKSVKPSDLMIITNAVYFLGKWLYPFDEELTKEGNFTKLSGEIISVPMMSKPKSNEQYISTKNFTGIYLPYEDFEAVILLPKNYNDMNFNPESFRRSKFKSTKMNLKMPRFKVECEFDLVDYLKNLGIKKAFGQFAEFTELFEKGYEQDCFISSVCHKTFLKVDESGTEAAAATSVVITMKSASPVRIDFIVDRPFLFFIRHRDSGLFIFSAFITM